MANRNRVQTGRAYFYVPVLLDRIDGRTRLEEGDQVRVVKLPGCPPPNTMGHAHVADLSGHFVGLVHVNSLVTREEYVEYLRIKIDRMEQASSAS
jgi:hypothetical protein